MHKVKALIVEDVPVAQKLAIITLKKLGCEIDTADTGHQAIKLWNENEYDLIFIDLGLPDIDGLQVTETIRRSAGGDHVPILALTAHATDACIEACLSSGLDDILIKPLTDMICRKIIDKFVGKL